MEKSADGSILFSSLKVMDLSLPASLLAQGSVKGKDNISHAESLGAEFKARNNLEGLSLAFP